MSAGRIQLQPGDHLRPGACVMGDVCIFTLETDTRAEVSLVLYRKGKKEPLRILPLDGSFRKGCSYSARVWPLDPEKMELYVYDFEHEELNIRYTFNDQVPVRISQGKCVIDFSQIRDNLKRIAPNTDKP